METYSYSLGAIIASSKSIKVISSLVHNKLEREIDEKREEFFRRRKAFAKKFQSMQEIDDLSAFIEDKNKDNHDEREMSKLKGIVREVKEDFKEIKKENREER